MAAVAAARRPKTHLIQLRRAILAPELCDGIIAESEVEEVAQVVERLLTLRIDENLWGADAASAMPENQSRRAGAADVVAVDCEVAEL